MHRESANGMRLLHLANYYGGSGQRTACVMSVGAGKTALGVVACLAFTQQRALVITPGSIIRGMFDRAFDHEAVQRSASSFFDQA